MFYFLIPVEFSTCVLCARLSLYGAVFLKYISLFAPSVRLSALQFIPFRWISVVRICTNNSQWSYQSAALVTACSFIRGTPPDMNTARIEYKPPWPTLSPPAKRFTYHCRHVIIFETAGRSWIRVSATTAPLLVRARWDTSDPVSAQEDRVGLYSASFQLMIIKCFGPSLQFHIQTVTFTARYYKWYLYLYISM